MEEKFYFNNQERELLFTLYKQLIKLSCDAIQKDDCRKLKGYLIQYLTQGNIPRNAFGMNPIIKDMQTAIIVAEEIGMKRAAILSTYKSLTKAIDEYNTRTYGWTQEELEAARCPMQIMFE